MTTLRNDPYAAFNFLVEIEGLLVGGFSEVTGLQIETDVEEYREGGQNGYVHKLVGPTRYPANLVLKRGLTDSDSLWRWHQEIVKGRIERKNGSIVLLDNNGEEKVRWNFRGGLPSKWIGPELNATGTSVATETLEIVHKGITKA